MRSGRCARDAISVMLMTDLRLFPILATPSDRTVTGSPRGREAPGVCRLTGPRTRPDPRRFYVCQDIWVLPSSSLKSSRATYLLRQRLISRGDLPSARRRAAYAMVGGWHLRRVRTMV